MPQSNGAKQERRVIDFNAFRREYRAKREPLIIPIDDQEYEFPAEMPASVMVELMGFMAEHGEEADIPTDLAMRILEDLLGADRLMSMSRKHGLDQVELFWLFERIMSVYMGQQADEGPEGNGKKPRKKAASTSSKTGRSSKRTSGGSTTSD